VPSQLYCGLAMNLIVLLPGLSLTGAR